MAAKCMGMRASMCADVPTRVRSHVRACIVPCASAPVLNMCPACANLHPCVRLHSQASVCMHVWACVRACA
eukprot:3337343-Alexandrium_andersonii.AAC.1